MKRDECQLLSNAEHLLIMLSIMWLCFLISNIYLMMETYCLGKLLSFSRSTKGKWWMLRYYGIWPSMIYYISTAKARRNYSSLRGGWPRLICKMAKVSDNLGKNCWHSKTKNTWLKSITRRLILMNFGGKLVLMDFH